MRKIRKFRSTSPPSLRPKGRAPIRTIITVNIIRNYFIVKNIGLDSILSGNSFHLSRIGKTSNS